MRGCGEMAMDNSLHTVAKYKIFSMMVVSITKLISMEWIGARNLMILRANCFCLFWFPFGRP
jgi:hypothetical protein